MSVVEAATEEQGIAFLGSDVDADGGKLILTAGAPTVTGDDEDRMLLALRKIVESDPPIPLRIGVHRGAVFAGDIGPAYRRTYTVMGDAVNLTARLMAKAEPGQIYATADVLDRANTLFATTKLEPFAVKGKAEPVQAWSVGRAEGSRTRQVTLQRLPLTGRNAELGVIRKAFTSARSGAGPPDRSRRATPESARRGCSKRCATRRPGSTSSTRPAKPTRRRSRTSCGASCCAKCSPSVATSPDADIVERIRAEVATKAPDLAPWLPLLAAVFDVEIAATPEVLQLAEKNRRAKLHETVARFLEAVVPEKLLLEIDDVHHMDEASAELLAHLTGGLAARSWLFAVGRRASAAPGSRRREAPEVVRIELKPLAPQDALRLAQLAAEKTSASAARARSRREAIRRQSAVPARPGALGDRIRRRRGPARFRGSGRR